MKKIVITGGSGRFASYLKKIKTNYKLIFPKKKELDITKLHSIEKYFKRKKPNLVIHLAGLSRPMRIHEKNIQLSIELNIIGTANIVRACANKNIKLIYFSTSYVYPGKKGNYKETDPVLPTMNYAWSKLGGECAVCMYKNSLILRICMTEKPFTHKKALCDAKTSFMYQDELASILMKLIKKRGIINVGGKSQTIYEFAKKDNAKVKKNYLKYIKDINFPKDSSINIQKLKKIITN
jgi:dTDP-4-dehydrorhamnose reductase